MCITSNASDDSLPFFISKVPVGQRRGQLILRGLLTLGEVCDGSRHLEELGFQPRHEIVLCTKVNGTQQSYFFNTPLPLI
jgi:hypothetical protein